MLTGVFHLSTEEEQGNEVQILEVSLNDAQSEYVDLKFYLNNGYAYMHLNYEQSIL